MKMRPLVLCSTTLLLILTVAQAQTAKVAAPEFSTRPAQNGAVILAMHETTAGASIHYTLDGSTPTADAPQYYAPLLVSTKQTIKAKAFVTNATSEVASYTLPATIAPGTLVWSDEFTKASAKTTLPDASVWSFEAGGPGAFGNHELEVYCGAASSSAPCDATQPNAYVGSDGYLHIVARKAAGGAYTSARLKSQGLFSMQYGRLEARIRMPQEQGLWPAFWLLGNNILAVDWPACGEQDVMEHINAPKPDWVEGSVHGIGFIGEAGLGQKLYFAPGQTSADWHTYGMIWSRGSVAYYVDDPAHPYVTYTPASLAALKQKGIATTVWPFDNGGSNFLLLNLAVGGDWPKDPAPDTKFPAEMLVDYVRIYAN